MRTIPNPLSLLTMAVVSVGICGLAAELHTEHLTRGKIVSRNDAKPKAGRAEMSARTSSGVNAATGPLSGLITTVAGGDWAFRIQPNGNPLNTPVSGALYGIAPDPQGNIYVSDCNNNVVLFLTKAGQVSVVAGNAVRGFSGDGGLAINASLNCPQGVGIDARGVLYIVDSNNSRIRKVGRDGTISTIAGNGKFKFSGDGGAASAAGFAYPADLAVDYISGTLYVTDQDASRIRRIGVDGNINTIAGNGTSGYTGDNGPATAASIDFGIGMAVDPSGNVYFADNENHVRKVSSTGIITTYAGTGDYSSTGDNGPATRATFKTVYGIAADANGNVFVGDFNGPKIRKIDSAGNIRTVVGGHSLADLGDGGLAVNASIDSVYAIAVDSQGNLFFSQRDPQNVRRVDNGTQIVTRVLGTGTYRNAPEGSPAVNAYFNDPAGVAVDANGNIFVADRQNHRIRKISASGQVTTLAGAGGYGSSTDTSTQSLLDHPSGVAVDSQGNVYFCDQFNNIVRRINPNGSITTVAGPLVLAPSYGYDGDNGPATQAHLNAPFGVAFDEKIGATYIADTYNHAIRRVDRNGIITTIAGNGQPGFSGDNGPATSAQLRYPQSVFVEAGGTLLIADGANYSVRRFTPGGNITTLAGNQQQGSGGDGGPAKQASLNYPTSAVSDSAGNIYVTEYYGHRIRKITTDGVINTYAGNGTSGFGGDGGPANFAQISYPDGNMALDSKGSLYFTDAGNNRLRVIKPPSATATLQVSPATTMSFSGTAGSTISQQPLSVTGSSFGLAFQAAATTSSGGSWLQLDTTAGTLPATVNVTASTAGLAAGTYNGSITITAPGATPSSQTISVSLTLTPGTGPKLSVDGTAISFAFQTGGIGTTGATSSQLTIRNVGSDTLNYTATAAIPAGGSWLKLSSGSGSVTAGSSGTVTLNADPTGLGANVYRATVTIAGSNTTQPAVNIPVTMVVTKNQPTILVSQAGLTFTAVEQAAAPLPQTLSVLNVGQGTLSWNASASTLSGGNWLGVSVSSGTVARPYLDISNFDVVVNPAGLRAGDYYGQIQVTAPGADNSPQTVSIVLNVLPAGTLPGPEVRPSGLVFTGYQGINPSSQRVLIGNTVQTGYNSSRLTRDGQSWFTHVPGNATITPGQSTSVVVQPDFTNLTPGVYYGAITFLFDGGTTRNVNVLSVVAPPGAGPTDFDGKTGIRDAGGCSPKTINITFTSAQGVFAAKLSQPNPVEAVIVDDCGNPLTQDRTGAAVSVTFSNGDPALRMNHVGAGKWTQTWQPLSAGNGAPVTVTVVAFLASASNLIGNKSSITANVSTGASVPLVAPGGVLNGASYTGDSPVAPGSLIAIYGQQLSSGAAGATSTPFPTMINDTTVSLGSRTLPLLYASGGQVNAQVPFDLPINSTQQLVVQRGVAISVPAPLTVAPAQPAIFTLNQQGFGQGAIVNGVTNVIADGNAPVTAGDVITIYCTGLGAVSPAIPSGAPAPTDRLVNTVNPVTVTVGGANAPVLFAGLAPGFAGLYQVNAQIPSGLTTGNSVPVALTVSGQTSPAATIAVK